MNHGVHVSANGSMSGYAWSPNIGWISFNSGDVSGCPSGSCAPQLNRQTGAVTGWARAVAGTGPSIHTGDWGGWISLSGSTYSVSATGCQWQGTAWGGGSTLGNGVIGWLSFSGPSYGVTGTGDACVSVSGADLTAGAVTPVSPTAGTPVTLRAIATNTGTGASGSFPMLFQVSETGAVFNSASIPGIAASASQEGSASHTFSAAATYQVRACANFTTSWVSVATETNYDNNCGPWTSITVGTAQSPALSCSVSSSNISPGQSVTYSANPSGGAAGPYTWTAADGGSFGTGATASRTLSTPGIYAMNVDTSSTAVSYCPNVTVTANYCMAGSANLTITAAPERVRAGQSTTLSWNASNVPGDGASCTVSGPGVSWTSGVSAAPSCSISGSTSVTISSQSTYTITCGGETKSVVVNVIPKIIEF